MSIPVYEVKFHTINRDLAEILEHEINALISRKRIEDGECVPAKTITLDTLAVLEEFQERKT